jgi:hypothetical protein
MAKDQESFYVTMLDTRLEDLGKGSLANMVGSIRRRTHH